MNGVEPIINDTVRRQTDRRQIYRYLYDSGRPVTAREIARELSFELSEVTGSLDGLLEEKMACCGPDQRYTLAPRGRIAVGLCLLGDVVQMLAIDMRAGELGYWEISIPFAHAPEYYEKISQSLEEFIDAFHLDRTRLLGVGIAIPGIIDQAEGRLVRSPTLELWDIPLEEIYSHFSRYPTFIENTPNASGYAERWADSTRTNTIYLSVDQGVGGAIVVGNDQYMGDHGRGGEFGHMRLVPNGRLCHCGRKGCVEAYCSTDRLSSDLGLTLEEFFTLLQAGDGRAAAVWEEYRTHLTDALVNLHICFDCDIILGGALSPHLESLLPELRWELGEKSFFDGDSAFLYLDHFRSHSACTGTALRFITDFLLTF